MKTTLIIKHYLTEETILVCDLVSSLLNKVPSRGDVLYLPSGVHTVTTSEPHQHFSLDQRGLSVSGVVVIIFVIPRPDDQEADAVA